MTESAHHTGDDIHVGDIKNSKAVVIGSGTVIYTEAAVQGVVSLHQLPPPPKDFTGRAAELAQLLKDAETGGVTLFGVRGQGGIGKTALALKLAEALSSRYPDAQFFLDLRGVSENPVTAAEALAHILRAYQPTAKLPESERELRAAYLTVLHGQRALLLLDNARDAEQVRPLLPPADCLLLVTSRDRFALPGLRACDLDELPPADAVALVRAIAPRAGEQAGDLAALCGYLPLALRLTASLLAERADLSAADVLRRLRDTQKRLALTGVAASLRLSYDLLTPELQGRWRTLAVFPAPFDRAAARAVWALADEDAALDVLSELVKVSLLTYRAGRYGLHDLSRDFAHAQCSAAEGVAAQLRHATHYRGVLGAANDQYLQGREDVARGLALFDAERAHIEAGQRWSSSPDLRGLGQSEALHDPEGLATAAVQLCNDYPNAGAHVLDLRLHPREHIRWLEDGLQAARQLCDRRSEGAALGNLGNAHHSLGDARTAIEFYEQQLVIAREIGYRRGEGAALGNLGLAHADLGDARMAIAYYEQALVVSREIGDRRGEGATLGNLGNAHADLGDARMAIEFYKQRLVIAREIGDRRGESNTLGNLGLAHHSLGDARMAIAYYGQVLVISREIGDRRSEGNALGNLGLAHADLGDARTAIEFYEQQLVIAREIGDRRGEGNALGNLGNAYYSLGDARMAIEFYEQQLVLAREIGDRRGEGSASWNLALALAPLGQRAEAITYAQASLKIKEATEDPRAEQVRRQLAEWQSAG